MVVFLLEVGVFWGEYSTGGARGVGRRLGFDLVLPVSKEGEDAAVA